MKSLTEISKILDISKPSLINRMKKIHGFKSRFCARNHNQIFIKDSGIKLISYQKQNSTSKSFHTKRGGNKNVLTKSDLVNTIHQLLSLNKAQKQKIHILELNNRQRLSSPKSQYHLKLSYTNLRKYLRSYDSKGALYRLFHKV